MNLKTLHVRVRAAVREGRPAIPRADDAAVSRLAAAERAALRAWQRHLDEVDGKAGRLRPVAGMTLWTAAPERELVG